MQNWPSFSLAQNSLAPECLEEGQALDRSFQWSTEFVGFFFGWGVPLGGFENGSQGRAYVKQI